MSNDKRNFDKEASSWDEHPAKIKLANKIAETISTQIVLKPEMDVLDYGCGTGLLTIQLQPFVRSITGVDNSRGMLDIFDMKVSQQKISNIKTVLLEPGKENIPDGSYNFVLCNMTLHHIKDTKSLMQNFYNVMAPGGILCITDLDPEEGRFHDDKTGVFHCGFQREALQDIFKDAGFSNIRHLTAAEVRKPDSTGKMQRFTVFFMIGQKREQ